MLKALCGMASCLPQRSHHFQNKRKMTTDPAVMPPSADSTCSTQVLTRAHALGPQRQDAGSVMHEVRHTRHAGSQGSKLVDAFLLVLLVALVLLFIGRRHHNLWQFIVIIIVVFTSAAPSTLLLHPLDNTASAAVTSHRHRGGGKERCNSRC